MSTVTPHRWAAVSTTVHCGHASTRMADGLGVVDAGEHERHPLPQVVVGSQRRHGIRDHGCTLAKRSRP